MTGLLAQADGLLGGRVRVPSESLRGACWLARTALEDAVADHLLLRGYAVGQASMAAKLACLGSATLSTDPEVCTAARFAWLGLSHASHHHAYELAPTVSEVKHLLSLVTTVVVAVEGLKSSATKRPG